MRCLQPPVSPPPPPPPAPPTETEVAAIRAHNEKRALHTDTGNLTWDADLAAAAQAWADTCVICCCCCCCCCCAEPASLGYNIAQWQSSCFDATSVDARRLTCCRCMLPPLLQGNVNQLCRNRPQAEVLCACTCALGASLDPATTPARGRTHTMGMRPGLTPSAHRPVGSRAPWETGGLFLWSQ
jgi:Cysteine-rich secretory protein family